MFESLTTRLGNIFDRLQRRAALTESDVDAALREIRIALLEADVALPVVKHFVSSVRERAVGHEVIRSVTPAQMVVKIVHDRLVELLGSHHAELHLGSPPSVVLMVGLQGSGKTTTSAKLARFVQEKLRRRALLVSLDVRRPAAQQQLATLARQVAVAALPIVTGEDPPAITARALAVARREAYEVVVLDTAGRLHIDEGLMEELVEIRDLAKPSEILLVADALTGQDAVNVARAFDGRVGITGIVLTRLDGDARGGAALSMRAVTGKPIKFVGIGEKLDALQPFHPERMASRILDMGDVVSLVEKAAELVDRNQAQKLAKKLESGRFDLADLRKQLGQIRQMGGVGGILSQLPGMAKVKQLAGTKLDDRMIVRQCAIIDSMTPEERRHPEIIHASRKRRIAAGSGTSVQEVNRLLKQHRQMQDMLKRVKKAGGMQRLWGRGLPPGMLPH